MVLNKPAGLPCHPGPRGGPSVEDCFPALSRRRDGPWLAHRLDADTAGCLLIALRKTALLTAQAEFAAGRAAKTYWAVVCGEATAEEGTIRLPIARQSSATGWRMHPDPAGSMAETSWRLRGRAPGRSWLELTPHTGRTHQIRVHCASIGLPLLGDPLYGGQAGVPLHLLARGLRLAVDPVLAAAAPVPAHMQSALAACGFTGCS